jgi:hypothetical protein
MVREEHHLKLPHPQVQKQAGHMPPLHSHQLHYITAVRNCHEYECCQTVLLALPVSRPPETTHPEPLAGKGQHLGLQIHTNDASTHKLSLPEASILAN